MVVFVLSVCAPGENARAAETQSKHVAGIADGFRDMPWGLQEKEAASYGLTRQTVDKKSKLSVYTKKNEELRFGGVPLLGIQYVFGQQFGFITVGVAAAPEQAKPLLEACMQLFGQPTATSQTKTEWSSDAVEAIYEFQPGATPMVAVRPNPKRMRQP